MVIFSFNTMLIKRTITKFKISAFELTYYQSLVCLAFMSVNMQCYGKNLRSIPNNLYSNMLKRVFFGVITDVMINLSFEYTNYSKAVCILFLNTLMIPFFANCIFGGQIRNVDSIAIIISLIGLVLMVDPFRNLEDN